jgi:tetratricopeptide (TPR) repeat protein
MGLGFARKMSVLLPLVVLLALGVWPEQRAVGEALHFARLAEDMWLFARAAEQLRKAATIESYRVGLWERIGRDELAAGNIDAAVAALRQAELRGELSFDGMDQLIKALEARADWAAAAQMRQAQIDRVGGDQAAYRALLADYRRASDWAMAGAAARSWQSAWPGSAEAAYQAAIFSINEDLKGAEHWMELCAQLDPRYNSKWQDLRQVATQATLSEDVGYRLTLIGRWLGSLAEWDLAENAFERAVKASPDFAEAWAFWGQAMVRNGKNGLPNMEKAVQINPKSVLAHALLGLYWGGAAQYERAIEQIQMVAALEPGQAVWQVELGNLTAANGDLVLARAYFTKAQTLEPDNPAGWEAAVRFSLTYQDDLRGYGLPAARRLVELRPNAAASLDLLGAVELGMGDLRGAERILQQALQINGDYAAAHLHLGQVYMQLQQNEAAQHHLELAVQLDGSGEVGGAARRILQRYFGGG